MVLVDTCTVSGVVCECTSEGNPLSRDEDLVVSPFGAFIFDANGEFKDPVHAWAASSFEDWSVTDEQVSFEAYIANENLLVPVGEVEEPTAHEAFVINEERAVTVGRSQFLEPSRVGGETGAMEQVVNVYPYVVPDLLDVSEFAESDLVHMDTVVEQFEQNTVEHVIVC